MSAPLRVLVTGSRTWAKKQAIEDALIVELTKLGQTERLAVLVHGGAQGADLLADTIWKAWVKKHPGLFATPECYPAEEFPDPKTRNLHMVSLGADVCVTFAETWASGTGHCARAARRAGIPTVDCGARTAAEDNPVFQEVAA